MSENRHAVDVEGVFYSLAVAGRTWPDRQWHPLLATIEVTPGSWELRDHLNRTYGVVRIIRRGGEIGYKVEFIDADGGRHLVGYRTNLAASCLHVHWRFLASHGPGGAPNGTS